MLPYNINFKVQHFWNHIKWKTEAGLLKSVKNEAENSTIVDFVPKSSVILPYVLRYDRISKFYKLVLHAVKCTIIVLKILILRVIYIPCKELKFHHTLVWQYNRRLFLNVHSSITKMSKWKTSFLPTFWKKKHEYPLVLRQA